MRMRLKLLLKTTALTLMLLIAAKVGWSAVITSNAVTGNWSAAATWVGGAVPGATDDVVIADGAIVTIDVTPITIASLTVGQGASGILTFLPPAVQALTVTGDVTIAAGGRFSMLPAIYVTGDITSGSPTVTNINTAGMAATNVITATTGLSGGSATVLAVVDGTSLTLSTNATATATGVLFAVYPTVVAQVNTIAIGGNITNNGIFDMSLGGGTAVCNATFNKVATSDQTITGTGALTRFRGITLNRANIADRVLATSNVYMNGSGLFVFTKGTWEQSAGILTIAGGNQTIGASGSLIFSGSGGLTQPGSSIAVTGNLTVNTSGIFNLGSGNNSITTVGTPTLNFLKGNMYIYGRLTLTLGITTIDGANIYISTRGANNLAGTSNNFEVNGATVNFSSGSLTLVDPNTLTTTGNDMKITTPINMTGGTIYIGDGVSTATNASVLKYAGFNLSTNGNTIKNLVIQTGGIVGRNAQLRGSLIVSGTLTLTSGTLDIWTQTLTLNNPIAGTATNLIDHFIAASSGGLSIAGTASNIIIPSSLDSLASLTINNANGAALQGNLIIKKTLNLTNGKLDVGSNNLALVNTATIAGASSSSYVYTSGTGSLKMNTVAVGAVSYPVGTANNYTPFISTNNTSADVLGVNVHTPITHATYDDTKIVNLEWIANEAIAGGNDGTVTFTWNVADQAANFDPAKPLKFAAWDAVNSKYMLDDVTISGTGPYTVTINAPITYPSDPVIIGNADAFFPPAPALTADVTLNNVDNNIDISFTYSGAPTDSWIAAVTEVSVNGTVLPAADYAFSVPTKSILGYLKLKPSATSNAVLQTAGTWNVVVKATNYTEALVSQVVLAGAPTANSTISNAPALAINTTSTVTLTAKDQFSNLVEGYQFKYDATVTNTNVATAESYTINGTATTANATGVALAATNASGVATFDIVIPAAVDPLDGVSVQVFMNDGTTALGSKMEYITPGTPTLSVSAPVALGELNLNGAVIDVTLLNETFVDGTFDVANFTLNNAPTGVTISGVALPAVKKIALTNAVITLAYDGTDFDANVTNLSVTIAAAELNGAAPLTSNDLTITAVVETAPVVVTNTTITTNGLTTATWGGEITSNGGESLEQYGLCWNTTGTPTITDSKTAELVKGANVLITGNMTGLTTGTKYYVRAYATNSVGTSYGSEYFFTTLSPTLTLDALGAATYYAGDAVALTWTSAGVTNVKIELYNGTSYSTLFASVAASDNGKSITIPAASAYGVGYKVKISDVDAPSVSSESAAFTVKAVTSSLIDLQSMPANAVVKYIGKATVTYFRTSRNQKFIQDATGAVLIDDPTTAPGFITGTYAIGDGITDIEGKIVLYNGLTEFTPTATTGATCTGNPVITPEVRTMASLTVADQSKLIQVNSYTFVDPVVDGGSANFVASKNYRINDGTTRDTVYLFRTSLTEANYIGTAVPTVARTSIALVNLYKKTGNYKTVLQIVARSLADFQLTGIDENWNSDLNVYPNPFTNEIKFSASKGVKRVIVSNIIGQVLKNVAVDQVNSVNTADLPRGIYLVTLMNSKGEKSTIKMIKQ
jgi:hypothetical protein